jgi:NADPH:quinone reductase-like Zn-dependent oxidoreductase
MKAIVFHAYGGPEVLQLAEIDKPTPAPDQVLIKVHAASVNPLDWHFMRGTPVIMRMDTGLTKPKKTRLGADLAGVIEAVGSAVTQFKVGDAVFGDTGSGSFAEYTLSREKDLALKPTHISFEHAASVTVAATTALQALRDHGQIKAGQRVLVNGASGGVGVFAVQIAKAHGAHVTGVCSTRNIELVRSAGADHVIDYTQTNFTQAGERYDIIIDNVANHGPAALQRALTPQGIAVVTGFNGFGGLIATALGGLWIGRTTTQKIGIMTANTTPADQQILREMLDSGKLKPIIDRTYPLAQTGEAIAYLETMRARGKVVLTMA